MRLLIAVSVLAACDHGLEANEPAPTVPVETVERPAVEPVAPTPTLKPAPAPKLGKIVSIAKLDNQTLCVRDATGSERCRKVTLEFRGPKTGQVLAAVDANLDDETKLTRAGVACTWRDRRLTCSGEAPLAVTEMSSSFHMYLVGGGKVYWFEPVNDGAAVLETMAPVPGGIAQLAIGFRVGCARTNNAEVYCWSDPKKPRKIAMPPRVAEIMIQDPFQLCARTESGELHCTAPFFQESLFCSKHGLACGTGEIEKVELKTSFDPLSKLVRPLSRVAAARSISRDDDPIYQFCLDSLAVGPTNAGACMLADGGVSCMSTCKGKWRVGTVSGLPATIAKIWSEGATGYALASDGGLWWWSRTRDCDGPANTAAKQMANLPPIADLAAPLSLRSGPQLWEPLRCALATTGEIRCWRTDRTTGAPAVPMDPMR